MAADRAPTIATTIQASFTHSASHVEPAFADRQQRARQRERQREDRVLELDHLERQPDSFPEHKMAQALLPLRV